MTATLTAPAHTVTPTDNVLELRDIVLEYPDGVDADGNPTVMRALDSVSLTAHRGTLTAVTGASGSGKSSLLSVAAGLITPTSGARIIQGNRTENYSDRQLAELRRTTVGFIFQQPNLLASLTAAEQLELVARISGVRGTDLKVARQRATELLDLVGLGAEKGRKMHQLSGGQRQRVNIARALMNTPTLLLADEPTSALDAERSASIVELLARITREFNTATLLITHDGDQLAHADRTVHMADGCLTDA